MEIEIEASSNNKKTLLSLCEEQGIFMSAFCGMHGTCGGCKIRLISGSLEPSLSDRAFFSDKELDEGYRLACMAVPKKKIRFEYRENHFFNQKISGSVSFCLEAKHHKGPLASKTFLLIDIGTTTIALLLCNESRKRIDTSLFLNPQYSYGSDVLSRLRQILDGKEHELSQILRLSLREEINKILKRNHLQSVKQICIAGNTLMTHLLLEYPAKSLASAPFHPYRTNAIHTPFAKTFVDIFPSISAFIGGDTVAGMYGLNFESRTDTILFIDLGTNGEMAILHNGIAKVASVAAGPAFEGGNLMCGGPSIPGAISEVTLGGIRPVCKTIENKLPIHLCGTGALSLISELLQKGYVKQDGIPTDKFPKDGIFLSKTMSGSEIRFTLEDFRHLQLALASLKAGYYTLLYECNLKPEEIDRVYLSGSFGSSLISHPARLAPIFPVVWHNRIEVLGNSCLQGLLKYAQNGCPHDLIPFSAASEWIQTISLAEHSFFKECFIKHLTFD